MAFSWKTVVHRIKQPEFRLVYYLLPLLILLFIINASYLPGTWIMISAGALVLFVLIMVVVSWRLSRAHIETKAKGAQMESIISHLSVGVLSYDTDFKVSVFNPAAEEIFGLTQDKIVGKTLSAQLGSETQYRILAQTVFSSLAPKVIKRSEPGAYPQVVDISFESPVLELRVITDHVTDAKGNPVGFLKLITNRTREMELLRSKTEFISVAAHQLRTPLTAAHWALESLVSFKDFGEEAKSIARTGFEASKKMLKTVNDLLDVSKIEEGKFGYVFASVDAVKFLEDILTQSNVIARQYGIKLYFQRPQEALTAVLDVQKMNMAVSNIIDNAIKYNVENGETTVSLQRSKDPSFLLVSIEDTGIGIPVDEQKHVFEKFYRSDAIKQHTPDGTGLGLYIAKNVVERHGGEIWFESEVNRGTTFYFTIPTTKLVVPQKELTGA